MPTDDLGVDSLINQLPNYINRIHLALFAIRAKIYNS